MELRVSKNPEPKFDNNGIQRIDKQDGRPLWGTQVFVLDESGGDVILITTAGDKPDVRVGQTIEVGRLEAIPWATNGRSGVAFRADELIDADDYEDED